MKYTQSSHPYGSVIICAAGNATRMGGIDKLMITIERVPVLIKSILAFEECELVDEIVIVTRRQEILHVADLIRQYQIQKVTNIVCGGDTRQQSVLNGLCSVSRNTEFLIIHDGARPLVQKETILSCIRSAYQKNCVVAGVPVKDTIKVVGQDGAVLSTPKRELLYSIQTPQVFRFDLYERAAKNAKENKLDFTDDSQMLEAIGEKVYIAPGDYTNIKLTTPDDIYLAQAVISERFAKDFERKGW